MSARAMGRAAPEGVALTVLTHLKNGQIDEAIARFVEQLTCKDHGLGLEFTDTARLAAFFRTTRALSPDSCLETHTIFVSGEHVIMAWTLHTSVTEPCYGGRSRKVHVSLHGASIARTEPPSRRCLSRPCAPVCRRAAGRASGRGGTPAPRVQWGRWWRLLGRVRPAGRRQKAA